MKWIPYMADECILGLNVWTSENWSWHVWLVFVPHIVPGCSLHSV